MIGFVVVEILEPSRNSKKLVSNSKVVLTHVQASDQHSSFLIFLCPLSSHSRIYYIEKLKCYDLPLPLSSDQEIEALPISPRIERPKFLSIAFRHGTSVNSREVSITAYFPLGRFIVCRNTPDI